MVADPERCGAHEPLIDSIREIKQDMAAMRAQTSEIPLLVVRVGELTERLHATQDWAVQADRVARFMTMAKWVVVTVATPMIVLSVYGIASFVRQVMIWQAVVKP